MIWNDADKWPGNYVMRWLANANINGVDVVLAMCTPDGQWISGREPAPVEFHKPVAWAEIEYPDPPVRIPARWVDPDEMERS